MLETHPYGHFSPPNSRFFLLGSFTGKPVPGYDWFYGSPRNQFWPILRLVYGLKLETIAEKQRLFTSLSLTVSDIIYQCERVKNSNLDTNLINIVYNTAGIEQILANNPLRTIYFTSRFVEQKFKTHFKMLIANWPNIKLITLPSPSPRYAQMTLQEKITKYSDLLPELS